MAGVSLLTPVFERFVIQTGESKLTPATQKALDLGRIPVQTLESHAISLKNMLSRSQTAGSQIRVGVTQFEDEPRMDTDEARINQHDFALIRASSVSIRPSNLQLPHSYRNLDFVGWVQPTDLPGGMHPPYQGCPNCAASRLDSANCVTSTQIAGSQIRDQSDFAICDPAICYAMASRDWHQTDCSAAAADAGCGCSRTFE